ncbi:MAG: hypothetical protein Q4F95_04155 [Oscillospiraceae bacterium]|nr:hypothetical protein [Oscillospiraceae bacterium]
MDDAINVADILKDINREVVSEGKNCSLISFEDFWMKKHQSFDTSFSRLAFLNDLAVLENNNQIEYYAQLTSFKNRFTSLVFFFKKVIRKSLKFLIYPMTIQQNSVNLHTMRCLQHLRAYVNSQENSMKNLSVLNHRILANSQNLETMNEQIYTLITEINNLKQENKELKNQIAKIGGESSR